MIVFEVRSDGTVVSTPSLVAQGISLSDIVVLADADYSLVTMHFTPPSGIYIPDVVFTPTHTQGRNLWQAVMPPEISRISGAVTYQIFLTSADGKTLPTPTGRITVQEGVISNMPETAEELGQYSISALYQLMANFYASLEGYRQTLDELTVKTHKWTILASDWTDSTPYQASIMFPHGNYAKPGTLILVAPADNGSREQIEKGGLTVTVNDSGIIGSFPLVDTAVIVRGGKAPTEDINLVLFFLDTQGEDAPLTQWIGIDMGSILPEVTPEDDGKVLSVVNGVRAWVDPSELEGVGTTEVVHVSVSHTADGDVYTSDKTVAEILALHDSGKLIAIDLLDSGYHWYFSDGWVAVTSKDPYRGVLQFANHVMYFTAENWQTETDVFNSSLKEDIKITEVSSPNDIHDTSPDGIYVVPQKAVASVHTSIDLSKLDAEGIIDEVVVTTFDDNTQKSVTKTTTMEFDEDGNPIKITDADGNETVLTW